MTTVRWAHIISWHTDNISIFDFLLWGLGGLIQASKWIFHYFFKAFHVIENDYYDSDEFTSFSNNAKDMDDNRGEEESQKKEGKAKMNTIDNYEYDNDELTNNGNADDKTDLINEEGKDHGTGTHESVTEIKRETENNKKEENNITDKEQNIDKKEDDGLTKGMMRFS